MIEINKTTNVSGLVRVNVGEDIKQVAILNASININGNYTSGRNIQSAKLYMEHKEEVDKDFSDFDKYVCEIAAESEKSWEEAKKKAGEKDAESTQ